MDVSEYEADPREVVERESFFNCTPDSYNSFGCSVSRPPYKFSKPGEASDLFFIITVKN